MEENLLEKIISLCKRRGFIFPSSEIYGGLSGFYDYGPLGVELKNNIKNLWWQEIVQKRQEVVGVDTAIILNNKVWKASGHVDEFSDLMTDCKNCKKRFRADHLIEEVYTEKEVSEILQDLKNINEILKKIKCPECSGQLTPARPFNLMFKTFVGPVENESSLTYLRPETCQGIFINFQNILSTNRLKLPFGIAQIGKAFRNEITIGNFIFRVREFEAAELEYFVKPKEAKRWLDFWKKERMAWHLKLGIRKNNLRFRQHRPDELAHYAAEAWDIEYNFPFGFKEIEGIANRTDYDLKNHSQLSDQDLSYFDEKEQKRYFPYVIEPSVGIDRTLLAVITDAYAEDMVPDEKGEMQKRVVLKLKPLLAPIKAGVFPLVKKPQLTKIAKQITDQIKEYYPVFYDESGSIGKRYRRQDEIGTPFCITVDFETIKDNTVTIRDRDTLKQERIKITEILSYLNEKIKK